jgi:hypothetical protein
MARFSSSYGSIRGIYPDLFFYLDGGVDPDLDQFLLRAKKDPGLNGHCYHYRNVVMVEKMLSF